MLDKARILIVEDDGLVAEDIAFTIEHADGVVLGPVATVTEALDLLDAVKIDAAILDGNLLDRDISPVAIRLRSANIPLIVYSGIGLPKELAALCPDTFLILKPKSVAIVVGQLAKLIARQDGGE